MPRRGDGRRAMEPETADGRPGRVRALLRLASGLPGCRRSIPGDARGRLRDRLRPRRRGRTLAVRRHEPARQLPHHAPVCVVARVRRRVDRCADRQERPGIGGRPLRLGRGDRGPRLTVAVPRQHAGCAVAPGSRRPGVPLPRERQPALPGRGNRREGLPERTVADRHRASPAAAGGKLYLTSRAGVVSVVRAGREFELLASNDVEEPIASSPVFVGDRLYLRTYQSLLAISETGEAEQTGGGE